MSKPCQKRLCKTAIRFLEAENKELQDEVKELKKQLTRPIGVIVKVEDSQNNEGDDKVLPASTSSNPQGSPIEDKHEIISKLEEELAKFKTLLQESETEKEDLQEKIDSVRHDNAVLTRQNKKFNKNLEAKEAELADITQKQKKMAKQVADSKSKTIMSVAESKSLKVQLSEAKKTEAAAIEMNEHLKQQLAMVHRKLADIQSNSNNRDEEKKALQIELANLKEHCRVVKDKARKCITKKTSDIELLRNQKKMLLTNIHSFASTITNAMITPGNTLLDEANSDSNDTSIFASSPPRDNTISDNGSQGTTDNSMTTDDTSSLGKNDSFMNDVTMETDVVFVPDVCKAAPSRGVLKSSAICEDTRCFSNVVSLRDSDVVSVQPYSQVSSEPDNAATNISVHPRVTRDTTSAHMTAQAYSNAHVSGQTHSNVGKQNTSAQNLLEMCSQQSGDVIEREKYAEFEDEDDISGADNAIIPDNVDIHIKSCVPSDRIILKHDVPSETSSGTHEPVQTTGIEMASRQQTVTKSLSNNSICEGFKGKLDVPSKNETVPLTPGTRPLTMNSDAFIIVSPDASKTCEKSPRQLPKTQTQNVRIVNSKIVSRVPENIEPPAETEQNNVIPPKTSKVDTKFSQRDFLNPELNNHNSNSIEITHVEPAEAPVETSLNLQEGVFREVHKDTCGHSIFQKTESPGSSSDSQGYKQKTSKCSVVEENVNTTGHQSVVSEKGKLKIKPLVDTSKDLELSQSNDSDMEDTLVEVCDNADVAKIAIGTTEDLTKTKTKDLASNKQQTDSVEIIDDCHMEEDITENISKEASHVEIPETPSETIADESFNTEVETPCSKSSSKSQTFKKEAHGRDQSQTDKSTENSENKEKVGEDVDAIENTTTKKLKITRPKKLSTEKNDISNKNKTEPREETEAFKLPSIKVMQFNKAGKSTGIKKTDLKKKNIHVTPSKAKSKETNPDEILKGVSSVNEEVTQDKEKILVSADVKPANKMEVSDKNRRDKTKHTTKNIHVTSSKAKSKETKRDETVKSITSVNKEVTQDKEKIPVSADVKPANESEINDTNRKNKTELTTKHIHVTSSKAKSKATKRDETVKSITSVNKEVTQDKEKIADVTPANEREVSDTNKKDETEHTTDNDVQELGTNGVHAHLRADKEKEHTDDYVQDDQEERKSEPKEAITPETNENAAFVEHEITTIKDRLVEENADVSHEKVDIYEESVDVYDIPIGSVQNTSDNIDRMDDGTLFDEVFAKAGTTNQEIVDSDDMSSHKDLSDQECEDRTEKELTAPVRNIERLKQMMLSKTKKDSGEVGTKKEVEEKTGDKPGPGGDGKMSKLLHSMFILSEKDKREKFIKHQDCMKRRRERSKKPKKRNSSDYLSDSQKLGLYDNHRKQMKIAQRIHQRNYRNVWYNYIAEKYKNFEVSRNKQRGLGFKRKRAVLSESSEEDEEQTEYKGDAQHNEGYNIFQHRSLGKAEMFKVIDAVSHSKPTQGADSAHDNIESMKERLCKKKLVVVVTDIMKETREGEEVEKSVSIENESCDFEHENLPSSDVVSEVKSQTLEGTLKAEDIASDIDASNISVKSKPKPKCFKIPRVRTLNPVVKPSASDPKFASVSDDPSGADAIMKVISKSKSSETTSNMAPSETPLNSKHSTATEIMSMLNLSKPTSSPVTAPSSSWNTEVIIPLDSTLSNQQGGGHLMPNRAPQYTVPLMNNSPLLGHTLPTRNTHLPPNTKFPPVGVLPFFDPTVPPPSIPNLLPNITARLTNVVDDGSNLINKTSEPVIVSGSASTLKSRDPRCKPQDNTDKSSARKMLFSENTTPTRPPIESYFSANKKDAPLTSVEHSMVDSKPLKLHKVDVAKTVLFYDALAKLCPDPERDPRLEVIKSGKKQGPPCRKIVLKPVAIPLHHVPITPKGRIKRASPSKKPKEAILNASELLSNNQNEAIVKSQKLKAAILESCIKKTSIFSVGDVKGAKSNDEEKLKTSTKSPKKSLAKSPKKLLPKSPRKLSLRNAKFKSDDSSTQPETASEEQSDSTEIPEKRRPPRKTRKSRSPKIKTSAIGKPRHDNLFDNLLSAAEALEAQNAPPNSCETIDKCHKTPTKKNQGKITLPRPARSPRSKQMPAKYSEGFSVHSPKKKLKSKSKDIDDDDTNDDSECGNTKMTKTEIVDPVSTSNTVVVHVQVQVHSQPAQTDKNLPLKQDASKSSDIQQLSTLKTEPSPPKSTGKRKTRSQTRSKSKTKTERSTDTTNPSSKEETKATTDDKNKLTNTAAIKGPFKAPQKFVLNKSGPLDMSIDSPSWVIDELATSPKTIPVTPTGTVLDYHSPKYNQPSTSAANTKGMVIEYEGPSNANKSSDNSDKEQHVVKSSDGQTTKSTPKSKIDQSPNKVEADNSNIKYDTESETSLPLKKRKHRNGSPLKDDDKTKPMTLNILQNDTDRQAEQNVQSNVNDSYKEATAVIGYNYESNAILAADLELSSTCSQHGTGGSGVVSSVISASDYSLLREMEVSNSVSAMGPAGDGVVTMFNERLEGPNFAAFKSSLLSDRTNVVASSTPIPTPVLEMSPVKRHVPFAKKLIDLMSPSKEHGLLKENIHRNVHESPLKNMKALLSPGKLQSAGFNVELSSADSCSSETMDRALPSPKRHPATSTDNLYCDIPKNCTKKPTNKNKVAECLNENHEALDISDALELHAPESDFSQHSNAHNSLSDSRCNKSTSRCTQSKTSESENETDVSSSRKSRQKSKKKTSSSSKKQSTRASSQTRDKSRESKRRRSESNGTRTRKRRK